jgi:RNA polymerase sigma-70 factor (ECF subfamily)
MDGPGIQAKETAPGEAGLDRENRRNADRFEPYLGRLFGYARSLTNERDLALEMVQDCVVKALAAAEAPANEAAYRAWLFRILRNATYDHLRRRSKAPLPLDDEPEIPERPLREVEESLINRLTVRRGLAKLGRAQREIIAIVDIAGFTYAEAASLLDVPQGTVMSRLSRARRALLVAVSDENVHDLPLDRRRSQS